MKTPRILVLALLMLSSAAALAQGGQAQGGMPPGGGQGGAHRGPPQEALDACKGKKDGDSAQMRTPRGGFRLPSLPSLPTRTADARTAEVAGGVDIRRWGLAGLGALVLILSAVFLPRAFEGTSGVTATPTSVAATAQATVQAGGVPGGGAQPAPTAAAGGAAASGAIAVPNLVGVARADAQARLQDAGLTSVVVEIANATVPAGQVASQQPAAGASVGRGENVTLIVSRGAPRN